MNGLPKAMKCSHQQKELLSRILAHGACANTLPTYSVNWQLSSVVTSFDRLAYTWQAIASHHVVLRTSITLTDGSFDLEVRKQASQIQFRTTKADLSVRGELDTAELVVYVGDRATYLCLRVHYALVDRPSLAHLRHDFDLFYNGFACEPNSPFKYYVRHIDDRDPQRALSYWRQKMSGVVTSLTYGIPRGQQGKKQTCTRHLNSQLVQDISQFCEGFGVPVHEFFYATWAFIQYRHTAATDGVVVFAVCGRDGTVPEFNTYVGLTEQLYPMKLQIKADLSALDWIMQVSDVDRKSASNAFIGYEHITREILPLEVQVQLLVGDGLEIVEEGIGDIKFPLVVNFDHKIGRVTMTYDSDRDENANLVVLFDHLITAMKCIIEDPRMPIGQVEIISEDEKSLLTACSEPLTSLVPGLVHKLVERQADITPEKEAVNFEDLMSMTYHELNKLANQVARQLPCKRGDNVPVCMDRTPNLIIAILAILKTGAAYVIIDPESPSDRCDYIVSDVQASLILTDEASATKFAKSLGIERLIEIAPEFEATNLLVHQEPSDVVYIIYTSGSTGRPKGVILEHTAAFTGLDAFPLLPHLRQLLFHNPVFSAAQRSIWSTLKQGGCLCLARKEHLTSQITDMINRMRVNVIDVTPSTASLIDPSGVPTLRRMTVAGELINPALLPIWMDRLELLNAYGLSEVTQINWRHRLRLGQNPQNIGRPVDSTRSYVLLPGTMRQASLLEPGELCLSGHQLARGYLNRPEKSEQSFIRNPFGPGRLYRTGDMVVAHPDGSIEMIGRIDFQVKINGQRVEPGEINYYLQEHHDVFDSCTVSTTIAGKQSLVAVVVPKNQQDWPSLSRKLQLLLRQQLPPYMVPPYWLPVPELPLNINGKVDIPSVAKLAKATPREKMLIRTLSSRDGPESAFLTFAQKSMRTIWSEVLAISETEISLDDSFLGLGGTSLEAIMAVSAARERLIDVKLQDILLHDSLRDVVKVSRAMASPLKQVSLPPFCFVPGTLQVERSLLEDGWPVTPSQEPLIADLVLGGTQYIYHRVFNPEKWSGTAVKAAFASLLNRVPFLRSTFVEHGSSYLQLVQKHVNLPWEVAPETLEEYIDSGKTPKLELGQPFCRVLEMKSGELIITFHHALFDYWSGDFFYEDIAALINQQPLIERPFYNQYVNFIREQDQSKTHKFWRDYLQGATTTKIEYLQQKQSEVAVCSNSLDLHSISKDIGIPIGSLLYAAWVIILSSETGLKDVTFGATFSGRDIPVPDILCMYGPTVTNALLRIQIRDNFSLRDVAKAVQYEVSRVSEHAYCGLRTILRAAGHSSALFNTTVNFLFRQSSVSEGQRELLHSFSPPVSDHIKFEVDSRHIERLSLTSPLDNSRSRSILDKLTTIFKCIDGNADTPISDVILRLRSENISSMYPRNVDELQDCLAHSLFERRAITNRSKIAVTDEYGECLTYEQLNKKANQLAAYLRARGVQPETIVPLYLEKSLNTLVSMFGIWKAGGAFCALDPANSMERNTLILSEVRACLVITDKENAAALANSGIEQCVLDQLDLSSVDSGKLSSSQPTPQNLAYVLYTSGSTGRPKGVLITHESVAAASQGMIKAAAITEEWRSLWALNYVFDGSYFDVFPLLGAGGTLCIARQQKVFTDLAGYINRLHVTHLNVTPTIAKTITPDEVPNLKVLVVGGEPLHSGIRDTWASRITVYNNYGPTEGTIMVTTTTVTANSSLNNIGSALSSAELSVRELETENLVPLGEIGELCISGPHVARGYLDRPETTKTAFFHDKAGRLVYRTGDLSRQLADGQFELYGRKDNQVKINGYRIELGEIETAIQNTNMVDGCVVLGKKAYGKLQLVACYKPFSIPRGISDNSMSPFLDPSVLKHIRSLPSKLISLAHYMMPTIWLPLAQFPLLPSGKIDRKSLSKLVEMIDPSLMAVFQATMSSNSILSQHTDAGNIEEVVLQQAWGLVFEKEPRQISTSSAFYTLGGDSIAAINLVSACRRQGYEITVADILAQPTIQLQAKRLRPLEYHQNSPVLIDSLRQFEDQAYAALKTAGIESNSIEAIYPCLPGQAEFLTQGRTEHQFWQLMTVRKVPPNFDLQRWTKLVTDLTARNQILRATFLNVQSPEGQKWVQAIFKDPVLDLDTIFYRTEKEKWHIIDALWESSFTVHKPAVQYRILKSSLDGSLDIYIKVDHGTYDGTLLRIFDEQFVAMAKGLQPPMVTEFHQLIHLYATSPAQKIQNFWISLLADASFAWPINVANPKVSKMTIRKTDLVINSAARDIGVTVPIIFQTAWGLLLGALSNSHDVVYDNLLTGRNVPLDNPQAINGNCANFLPFRSRFPPAARLHTLLHDTQALLWDTTDNGLIGLADIYHALGVQRSERAAKTMFCFQPFDPPPKGDEGDMDRHMRWVVMAMSTNRMFFNYAFMCEVFKAVDGYSIKFQYDSRALSDEEAKRAGDLYLQILEYLYTCGQEDTVDGLWKAVGVSMA